VVSKMPWFTLHGTMTQIVIIPFSRVWFKVTPTEVVWVVVRARLVTPRCRESFPIWPMILSFKKSYRRYELWGICFSASTWTFITPFTIHRSRHKPGATSQRALRHCYPDLVILLMTSELRCSEKSPIIKISDDFLEDLPWFS
jgi:hypothetical protein